MLQALTVTRARPNPYLAMLQPGTDQLSSYSRLIEETALSCYVNHRARAPARIQNTGLLGAGSPDWFPTGPCASVRSARQPARTVV